MNTYVVDVPFIILHPQYDDIILVVKKPCEHCLADQKFSLKGLVDGYHVRACACGAPLIFKVSGTSQKGYALEDLKDVKIEQVPVAPTFQKIKET